MDVTSPPTIHVKWTKADVRRDHLPQAVMRAIDECARALNPNDACACPLVALRSIVTMPSKMSRVPIRCLTAYAMQCHSVFPFVTTHCLSLPSHPAHAHTFFVHTYMDTCTRVDVNAGDHTVFCQTCAYEAAIMDDDTDVVSLSSDVSDGCSDFDFDRAPSPLQ